MMTQIELFATKPELPEGFVYKAEFVSSNGAQALIQAIEQLEPRSAFILRGPKPGCVDSTTFRRRNAPPFNHISHIAQLRFARGFS